MTTTTKQCQCGANFEGNEFEDRCLPCAENREREWRAQRERKVAEERENGRRSMLAHVDRMTPDRLRTPDLAHPKFDPVLWHKVSAWQPTNEKPWLGLFGPTGTCKTRCAYLRLRQFADYYANHWDGRRDAPAKLDAVAITGMEFNRWCVERFSKELDEARGMGITGRPADIAALGLRRARTADFLIFDEMGKVKPTSGTADELFALIDYRHAHNLVTIWTSNRPPEIFCAAWPEEYANPGAGRIIESSFIITA